MEQPNNRRKLIRFIAVLKTHKIVSNSPVMRRLLARFSMPTE